MEVCVILTVGLWKNSLYNSEVYYLSNKNKIKQFVSSCKNIVILNKKYRYNLIIVRIYFLKCIMFYYFYSILNLSYKKEEKMDPLHAVSNSINGR